MASAKVEIVRNGVRISLTEETDQTDPRPCGSVHRVVCR